MQYKRIFLKISGEALAGKKGEWLDYDHIRSICSSIHGLQQKGYQIAMMVWAGNIFRGQEQWEGIDPAIWHYAGMLATMVNALVMQNIMYQKDIQASVFSAIEMPRFIKTINKISAVKRLDSNMIVICAGGSGNPFCTTDLGSVIRALELDCEIVVKCTNIDWVYTDNPKTNPDATKYDTLTYQEAISKELQVMDLSAFGMAIENKLPTYVTHIDTLDQLDFSTDRGTLITA